MMIGKHDWWRWIGDIDKKTCDKIIKLGKSKLTKEKAIVGNNKEQSFHEQTRNSNVSWLNDQWLYDILKWYFEHANKAAGWNFQYDWFESIQFTSYKKNQHYNWHMDLDIPVKEASKDSFGKTPEIVGKMRKLSCVINLSDPKKFKGGEFYFGVDKNNSVDKNIIEFKELRKQGSVVVFPSYLSHKVGTVLQGNRYSLVCWALGAPFK
jgi:PKHD-type hydroxylase|tara:strand:- start:1428 stop:2051 length:624 start_codon:yes stop_codon:yes gene_type:complete